MSPKKTTQADKIAALVAEIREYCAAHADPKQVERYARYFKEGYDAWGLFGNDNPLWTQKKAEWKEQYRGLGLRGFLQLGEVLFRSGKYEEGALATQFVKEFRDEFDAKTFQQLQKWFEAGIGNWAHTDGLCGEVISPLIQEGRIPLEAMASWRESEYKYQRRAVPVGMLDLLKVRDDVKPLLEFVRPLMMDPEKVVQQGLGWFLREAWKRHPKPVEKFLLEWKETAPRVIFQYATEKMSKEDRERFRRTKKAKTSKA